jgi:tetratricopeptide (TPR) repeat protein
VSRIRSLPLALALGAGLTAALPAHALDGVAGPYLAARQASIDSDYRAAADYYTRAIMSDPSGTDLLESAIFANIGAGNVDRAVPMAQRLEAAGSDSQIASLVMMAEYAHNQDFTKIIAELDKGKSTGKLVDGLLRAWAQLGLGQMSEATTSFDAMATAPGLEAFGLYHKALALASVGDFEGADKIFSGEEGGPLRATRRGVFAHAQVLSQLERDADALELIKATFGDNLDPGLAQLRDRLAAGETLPFTMVTSPTDGVAEVFYTVAGALNTETTDVITLAYARLGEYLRPDHVDAILLTASILEEQKQFDLANEVYNRIPRDDPSFSAAELGRAEALIKADRVDAAIEVLQQLAKAYPDLPTVWTTLGDTLRRQERYGDAIGAYDSAIKTFKTEQTGQWVVFYARGISNEREKRWTAAEADFRKALKLQPDQPQVLNYLGYSYLEMNTNLDDALSMIKRAVAARPDDGYIVDSLGWGLYRLGHYEEAVDKMEQAVGLVPDDSIVNDHLGDVYWAVGRRLEAEFQWRRALSFKPNSEDEAARIRRKLEVGLDAVLKEEGAEPLAVTKNGN